MRTAVQLHQIASRLHRAGVPLLPSVVTYLMRFAFGCWVPASARIGARTQLGYGGLGVVIHSAAVVGTDCLISQGVTLGGGRGGAGSTGTGVPVLGDHVHVGAGAKILGGVMVGDRAVVGANAVVTRDVAPGAVVVGVPAREL